MARGPPGRHRSRRENGPGQPSPTPPHWTPTVAKPHGHRQIPARRPGRTPRTDPGTGCPSPAQARATATEEERTRPGQPTPPPGRHRSAAAPDGPPKHSGTTRVRPGLRPQSPQPAPMPREPESPAAQPPPQYWPAPGLDTVSGTSPKRLEPPPQPPPVSDHAKYPAPPSRLEHQPHKQIAAATAPMAK